ncbi:MAG TPA: HNH endonuclease signature motif containing protein [Acidimicrobiales bacterium]|nr:HNH endonuclease signature motif containing protein [Acidimicrobiales bacterium]
MATTDQRSRRKGSEGPAPRGTARSGKRSANRSDATSSGASDATGSATHPDVSAEAVAEAISLLESFVSAFEPGRYSGDDAAVLVERFSVGEHLCATGKALAAKRAAEAELFRRDGHRSAAEWLAGKTGESRGSPAGSLRLADQMEDHPGLGDALRSGELSPTRARQVADVLQLDPNSEDELVKAAKDPTETNRQLQDRCLRAKAKARSAEESHAAYERIRAARYLHHYTDRDGAFRLEGLFTPDAGAKLLAALKPTKTVIFDQARREGRHERPDAYEADALVALLTGERPPAPRASTDSDQPDSDQPVSDRSESDEPDSDRSGFKQPGSGRAGSDCRPTGFPPPASVHLRVDLAALRRGQLQDGECCEIPGVGPVPLQTAREVLGDAIVHLVITDGADVTSITNLGRTIKVPLRRALIERDPTCVVPGCDVRDGLEIDHRIVPVAENGETALWNLARLCHHHHYLRHHKGFRLEGGPGDWQWLPPEKPPPRDQGQSGSGDSETTHDGQLFQLE